MIDKLVKEYINKLQIADIIYFAKTKNIILENNEAEIIYKYIISNWYTLLHKDPTNIFTNLEKDIGKSLTDKIKILYDEYFNKYKSYL